MRHLALLLVLASCAPTARCTTRCGMTFYGHITDGGAPEGWSCEEVQRAEHIIDQGFREKLAGIDPRFGALCGKLPGWRLFVNEAPSWIDEWGRHVAGLTRCFNRTIEVGNAQLFVGSFVHELAHVAQGCAAVQPPTGTEDPAHASWVTSGIYKAIEEIQP